MYEVMNGCYFWRMAFCAFLLKGLDESLLGWLGIELREEMGNEWMYIDNAEERSLLYTLATGHSQFYCVLLHKHILEHLQRPSFSKFSNHTIGQSENINFLDKDTPGQVPSFSFHHPNTHETNHQQGEGSSSTGGYSRTTDSPLAAEHRRAPASS